MCSSLATHCCIHVHVVNTHTHTSHRNSEQICWRIRSKCQVLFDNNRNTTSQVNKRVEEIFNFEVYSGPLRGQFSLLSQRN